MGEGLKTSTSLDWYPKRVVRIKVRRTMLYLTTRAYMCHKWTPLICCPSCGHNHDLHLTMDQQGTHLEQKDRMALCRFVLGGIDEAEPISKVLCLNNPLISSCMEASNLGRSGSFSIWPKCIVSDKSVARKLNGFNFFKMNGHFTLGGKYINFN